MYGTAVLFRGRRRRGYRVAGSGGAWYSKTKEEPPCYYMRGCSSRTEFLEKKSRSRLLQFNDLTEKLLGFLVLVITVSLLTMCQSLSLVL